MCRSILRNILPNDKGQTPVDFEAHFSESGRDWTARLPASDKDIDKLQQIAPNGIPEEYIALLRYSNGGAGPLALPPHFFQLYELDYACDLNQHPDQLELYPGFFVFGSNGGLESIAFDTRGNEPWPIVMFDPVAGTKSAMTTSRKMEDFIRAIGIEYKE